MTNSSSKGFPKESNTKAGLWNLYQTGLSNFKNKNFDDGLKQFEDCYETVISDPNSSTNDFRLSGMCLKKIGWYYRTKKDYIKAFAFHSKRLALVRVHGSPNEIHDALISLDVDVYFLKNMHLSEIYLQESLTFAEKIENEENRITALATSYNNLGGTLSGLKKFAQALESVEKALIYWKEYEVIAGTKEYKVPWAYYGIGDVYELWAKDLKEQNENYDVQKNLAIKFFKQSMEQASQVSMPADQTKWIQERLDSSSSL